MSKGKYYILDPKLVLRREQKEGFIYNSATGALDIVNLAALSILELCNGKNSDSDIINKTAIFFSGNKRIIQDETTTFLKKMEKVSVIRRK